MAELTVGDEEAQLCTFKCSDCYVYAPLPPAPHYGHRAELWNPDKWFKIVRMRVVVVTDDMFIRLEDKDTGELFAECPLPSDGTPFSTAVEPVIDSSRYFVLKVVDRAQPKKHAFLGVGFRERSEASNFTAALDDHRQYLRRMKEAEVLRKTFEERAQLQDVDDGEAAGSPSAAAPAVDYSLKPGEKIRLNISNSSLKRRESAGGASPAASTSGAAVAAPSIIAASDSLGGPLKLQPPPPAGPSKKQLDSSGGAAEAAGPVIGNAGKLAGPGSVSGAGVAAPAAG